MIDYREIQDISLDLGRQAVAYPGDPPFERRWTCRLAEGGQADVSHLCLGSHYGSHLEAPGHFIPGGACLDQYPVSEFIRPARVIEAAGRPIIEAVDLAGVEPQAGQALLFKTDNSLSGLSASGRFSPAYVSLSPGAARACLELEAGLVGLDYLSVDALADQDQPVHQILLGAGLLILESLNLAGVAAGDYTLICLPLNYPQAEASPVRAVLVR